MNVNDLSAINKCTSCQLCSAVCHRDAITIDLNENGFYRPFIEEKKCIDCGACVRICYKFDNDIKISDLPRLKNRPLYAAWANERQVLDNTTSGGLGDLLAKHFIQEGYKVVGCIYDTNSEKAVDIIANSVSETIPFRGSKYIQSYTIEAFKEVVATCKKQKYAVFGLPCQIYALNRFATQRNIRNQFFFIDLYCHGCPSMLIWEKYIANIKQTHNIGKVEKVCFRSKKRGWGRFCIDVSSNGNVFTSIPHKDFFYDLFFSNQLLNECCSDCKLRQSLEYTDIRLGDFWGTKYVKNRTGVSGISLATEKGEEAFKSIANEIEYNICDYDDFLPFQSWDITYEVKKNLRDDLLDSLRDSNQGIKETIKVLRESENLKQKVIRILKIGLFHMPYIFTVYLKRLKN